MVNLSPRNCCWCSKELTKKQKTACSRKHCALFLNTYHNPAKTEKGRAGIRASAIKRGTAYLRTPEMRAKRIKSITGSGHWNWQGGITPETTRLRNLAETKNWRRAVFERDNYTCVECGARNGRGRVVILNADHIKSWSLHPKLRLELSNGRTLCLDCHKKTDTYAGKSRNKCITTLYSARTNV